LKAGTQSGLWAQRLLEEQPEINPEYDILTKEGPLQDGYP